MRVLIRGSNVSDDSPLLPDVRDGLNRRQRIILYCIHELQKERGGNNVPTIMLYGRVVEYMDISMSELRQEVSVLTDLPD